MKNIIYILIGFAFLLASCADENKQPILTFDQSGKGAYVKLIDEGSRILDLSNIPGAAYNYSVEFVDLEEGDLVAEYNIDVNFDDNTPGNGDQSAGPVRFRSIPASEFTEGPTGFKALDNIEIKLTDLLAAFGYTEADLALGDVFQIDGEVVLNDGSSFRAGNSSAAVNGSAFQGHFAFDLNATCPTSLAGDYEVVTTDVWCNGSTATGTTSIVSTGGVSYGFADWSHGAYGVCYGGAGSNWGVLGFKEECSIVSFTGLVDNYGDTWTFDTRIEGDKWILNWVNTYGESGNSTITFPGGVPFTLAE